MPSPPEQSRHPQVHFPGSPQTPWAFLAPRPSPTAFGHQIRQVGPVCHTYVPPASSPPESQGPLLRSCFRSVGQVLAWDGRTDVWSRHSASRSAQTPTTEKPKARFCSLTDQPSFVVLDSGPTPAICVPREGEKYSLEAVSLGATRSDAIVGKNYRVEEVELVGHLICATTPPPPKPASEASWQGRCHCPRCAEVVDSAWPGVRGRLMGTRRGPLAFGRWCGQVPEPSRDHGLEGGHSPCHQGRGEWWRGACALCLVRLGCGVTSQLGRQLRALAR